jgi:hypothetical protein
LVLRENQTSSRVASGILAFFWVWVSGILTPKFQCSGSLLVQPPFSLLECSCERQNRYLLIYSSFRSVGQLLV